MADGSTWWRTAGIECEIIDGDDYVAISTGITVQIQEGGLEVGAECLQFATVDSGGDVVGKRRGHCL